MSALSPLPTVADFLAAHAAAVRTDRGQEQNTRRGSVIDLTAGPAAMAWAMEAARDRDLFRNVYTDTAQGARLDDIVTRKYGVPRITATRGTGSAILVRPTTTTAGTIFEGTRIEVRTAITSEPSFYAVAEDTTVAIGVDAVTVPVKALRAGSGVLLTKAEYAALADTTFGTFTVQAIQCSDGRDEEKAIDYVARARRERKDLRPGYRKRFRQACLDAGAAHVVILDAGELGEAADFGVTHVYVGDSGYSTPDALLDACSDAVDAVHVAGCDVQVLPMTPSAVTVTLSVTLWGSPGNFDTPGIRQAMTSALVADFNRRTNFWLFDHDSLRGVARAAGEPAVQDIGVVTDPVEPTPAFLATLPRYTLAASDLLISFSGPT